MDKKYKWTFTPSFDMFENCEHSIRDVFGKLWRYCENDGGKCYASLNKISRETGYTRPTIIRAIRILRDAGFITDENVGLRNRPHTYYINYEFVDNFYSMIKEDKDAMMKEFYGVKLSAGKLNAVNSVYTRSKVTLQQESNDFTPGVNSLYTYHAQRSKVTLHEDTKRLLEETIEDSIEESSENPSSKEEARSTEVDTNTQRDISEEDNTWGNWDDDTLEETNSDTSWYSEENTSTLENSVSSGEDTASTLTPPPVALAPLPETMSAKQLREWVDTAHGFPVSLFSGRTVINGIFKATFRSERDWCKTTGMRLTEAEKVELGKLVLSGTITIDGWDYDLEEGEKALYEISQMPTESPTAK